MIKKIIAAWLFVQTAFWIFPQKSEISLVSYTEDERQNRTESTVMFDDEINQIKIYRNYELMESIAFDNNGTFISAEIMQDGCKDGIFWDSEKKRIIINEKNKEYHIKCKEPCYLNSPSLFFTLKNIIPGKPRDKTSFGLFNIFNKKKGYNDI